MPTASNKYFCNIPFDQDALNVLPEDVDVLTHFLGTLCVLPDDSEHVQNCDSSCGDASTWTLVRVGIQQHMAEEETATSCM